jgi:hypothetical protein
MKVIDVVLPKPTLKRDGNIIYFLGAWQEQKPPEPPNPPPHPDAGEFLREQGIPFRSDLVFALNELGAYDLHTIAAVSYRKLKACQGVGGKSITKLRAFLQSKGLDLRE